MSILEGELAQTIAEALIDAAIPYAITLHRWTPGEPGPDPFTPGTPATEVSYTCQGFTEAFEAEYISGGLVETNDLKVVILASTLSVTPELTDTVTVRGQPYSIMSIAPDPALATYALQVRA